MYIGNDAQAAIQRSQRGYGGQVYLDDGRCSGWFTVAPDQGAPAQQARASSGSICALVSTIGNRAGVAVDVYNGGWSARITNTNPLIVRQPVGPVSKTPWQTRVSNAVKVSLSFSRGPSTTAFSPLGELPNQYRIR